MCTESDVHVSLVMSQRHSAYDCQQFSFSHGSVSALCNMPAQTIKRRFGPGADGKGGVGSDVQLGPRLEQASSIPNDTPAIMRRLCSRSQVSSHACNAKGQLLLPYIAIQGNSNWPLALHAWLLH